MQTLRWDDITANDVITTIDAFQLFSGFVAPVLEQPDIEIDYVPCGWIPHIRDHLRAIGGQISIEKTWRPQLQRLGDDSLMEVIAACLTLTPKERRLANEFCQWLR